MTEVTITVGGRVEDATARIADRMKRAAAGAPLEPVREINFSSWEALTRTMTGKRLALLRELHRHPSTSVHELARSLGRDHEDVSTDVGALIDAGLIERNAEGLRVEADTLTARIAL